MRNRACTLALLLLGAATWPASGQAPRQEGRTLETARDVSGAVRGCWRVPDGLKRFERLEATVRFSLRADGTLIGERRISYMPFPTDGRAREILARSIYEAIEGCAPLNLSAGLGQAIAGRVFAVRFIYRGPQGRGA